MVNLKNIKVDNGNRFAVASANAVVEKLGILYNPYVIYGDETRTLELLSAIKSELSNQKIVNITFDDFKKEYDIFLQKYKDADILMINQLDGIENNSEFQRKLLYIVTQYHKDNKQMIFAFHNPLETLKMDQRLRARLTFGLTVELRSIEYE